jgi:hypothetical protein
VMNVNVVLQAQSIPILVCDIGPRSKDHAIMAGAIDQTLQRIALRIQLEAALNMAPLY